MFIFITLIQHTFIETPKEMHNFDSSHGEESFPKFLDPDQLQKLITSKLDKAPPLGKYPCKSVHD